MGMPVETTTVSVNRAENTDIQRPFAGGVQQVIDRQAVELGGNSQEGQARLWQALVMYFTCGQLGLSRRPPASRKEAQHWLTVKSFLSGRGVKPDSMGQINPRNPAGE